MDVKETVSIDGRSAANARAGGNSTDVPHLVRVLFAQWNTLPIEPHHAIGTSSGEEWKMHLNPTVMYPKFYSCVWRT